MALMIRYLIIVILLFSCSNPNKLHKMMDKLPEASAKECAQRFPIKETIETVTVADTALLHQYEIEFEAGNSVNEPTTYAVRIAIEAAVADMIKEGAKKKLWSIKKK